MKIISVVVSAATLMVAGNTAWADTISQTPLQLSESVPPNLILTLDDSGSMMYAFTPDATYSRRVERKAKSSAYNQMYYNPTVTYRLPVKVAANGDISSAPYSTSFTNAPNNGFRSGQSGIGSLNLASQYVVSWSYNPAAGVPAAGTGASYGYSSSASLLAENPPADFTSLSTFSITLSLAVGQVSPVQNNFIGSTASIYAYTVKRTGASTCEVNFQIYNSSYTTSCSVSGNTFTVRASAAADLTKAAVPAYYYVYDQSLMGCPNSIADDRCYRLVNVSSTSGVVRADDLLSGTDERQNFAIWYSFYRNRVLATMSGANLAFNALPSNVRVTWQSLVACAGFNSNSTACNKNFLRRFSGSHRGNFFSWLSNMSLPGSTPLLQAMARAGSYIQTSDPWAYDPNPISAAGVTSPTVVDPVYSCRPSYQIMMTDGIWNSTATSPWGDEADRTLPDGKKYTQQRPFFDATTNTLADLAFYYWATDARPTLGNNVKPVINAPNTSDPTAQYWDPRNDPATWQHLVTFTIGLGLSTSLNANGLPWAGDTYTGPGYQALATGAIVWPPATSGSGNNVYDLWHAAINSRGQFFSADSPDALLNAFNKIINLIGNATSTASMPAVKSAKDDTQVYRAEFTSADWSGDLIKSSSNASGGWSAKAKLDAKSPGERKIMMYDAQDTTHLKAFSWDNLTAAQQAQLSRNPDGNGIADSKGAARVTYLRGDHAGEGTAVGNFRKRDTVLGDIVSSSPLVVGPPVYWGSFADSIEGTGSDYNAFKTANSGRTTMVYVGANDGMLHGFNANTGEENFAYIPSAVIENLYLLTGQSYTGSAHRYFVDGTPVSADVYFDGNWHTVLIGTLGGGGRSLFALDVTDPNNIKLLWEKSFDVNDSNLADLGYSFSKPYIARLYSGQWAVITGNGYSGTSSGNAALMLFDVKTGNVLKKLSVTGNPGQPNGLSSPVVSDYNNDGVAEYAYAGDLQGNLWRFDLIPNSIRNSAAADPFKRSGANGITDNASYVNEFQVAYGGKPLFTAKDSRASALSASQPITAPPSLVRHPTGLGYLVLFGTGKYFEVGDAMGDASRAMSLYGIWDRKTKAQSTDAPASPLTRSDLVTQAFVPNGASTPDKRTLSRNPMVWYQPTATGRADSDVNAWGWVLDLVVGTTYTGELSVHPLKVRGSTLLVDSLIPTNDPCKGGANKWPMGIDVYSGGATLYSVFDINGDGVVDSSDLVNGQVISGYQSGGGGTGGTTTKDGYLFSSDGGPPMRYSSGPNFNGRQSWRSIPEEAQ